MSNNMELWGKVKSTDPAMTKKAKIGQFEITAIKPHYQRQLATEQFGPFGIGWGVKDETFDHWDADEDTRLVHYHATMWYKYNDQVGEFPINSTLKIKYKTNNGYIRMDDEWAKKVSTDALTKGLSYLGFNADVFMGLFDDSRYVDNQRHAVAQEKAVKAANTAVDSHNVKRQQLIASFHKLGEHVWPETWQSETMTAMCELVSDKKAAVPDQLSDPQITAAIGKMQARIGKGGE